MSFRLFGIPVEVQLGFWLTAVLLRLSLLQMRAYREMIVWVGVVFLSILIHELGHAVAIKRHKIDPEISLHWLGGTTTWRALIPLGRPSHVIISLAGPFAGFFAGAVVLLLTRYVPALQDRDDLVGFGLRSFVYTNIGWGIFNLIPVLPFDGGHVLEHALGPKRARLTAIVSLLVAGALAIYFATIGWFFMAVLLGMSAFQSYQRYQTEPMTPPAVALRRKAGFHDEPLPAEASALLRKGRDAIFEERSQDAIAAALEVLALSPPPPQSALREALEIVGWAKIQQGDFRSASEAVGRARRYGEPDAALTGAVHLALGERKQAKKVLEAARAEGDERKEVSGLLIRALVELGEVARAAAVAFDIVESLSEEDARKMAEIAFEHGAFDWSARLYEAIFQRNGLSEDAYGAARANAKDGDHDKAIELLKSAVDAGFSDRARAWSDSALSALQGGRLEAVVPRP